ncbi:MAG: glycoside hydrolase family 13 protein [Chloroflexi bacterium]|nr:glycoside hydrolase family 13 protein [Chloroflexota bacterium]
MTIQTPAWVKDAIFYQIFPDRFAKSNHFGQNGYLPKPSNLQAWGDVPTFYAFQGGDLLGAMDKLDYLQELGVNAIYLNPIFSSASNHRYHTHDYYTVDPILGGNKAFQTFLQAAHKKDIRVILDGVFNHASRGFFQFNHLLECGQESPYVDWFHVYDWPVNAFDLQHQPNYAAWWGIHSLPKLNTETTAVREFLWNVGVHWLEQGIDGWRLDVPNEIDDDTFWQEFRQRCKAVNPDAYIVGELWREAHRWLQGDQFDGQMNYLFTRAAFGFFVGDNMDQTDTERSGYGIIQPLNAARFGTELDRIFNHLYDPDIVLSQMNMLGSHDTPRLMTIARGDVTAVKQMILCQMTIPGAPNIYYGDEIGLEGHHDPDCRRAFPWQDKTLWNDELRNYTQQCIQLRHKLPALRRGNFHLIYSNEHVVMYQRQYQGQMAVVAFNTASHPETIICPPAFEQQLVEQLVNEGSVFSGGHEYVLNGRSGRVWAN